MSSGKVEGIRYGWERPQPLPGDFIFVKPKTVRTTIADKREGFSVPSMTCGYGSALTGGYASDAYFIFVMTPDGDLRVTVSKEVFDLLEIGDPIIVKYRSGRWTQALEGKIAS